MDDELRASPDSLKEISLINVDEPIAKTRSKYVDEALLAQFFSIPRVVAEI